MHYPAPRTRIAVTLALVLSTGGSLLTAGSVLTGGPVLPGGQALAWAPHWKVAPARKVCCCGTPDGRCCGKSCCLDQSKTSLPARQPLRTGSEKSPTEVLAVLGSTCQGVAPADTRAHGGATADQLARATASSLQSRHVRIQT